MFGMKPGHSAEAHTKGGHMRRVLTSMMLFLFILTICACAATEVKRSMMDDNVFFSSSKPAIRIKLDPLFKLAKEDEKSTSGFDTHGSMKTSNVKVEQYIFSGSGSKKDKAVMIEFQELVSPRWEFNPTLFKADNVFDSGSIKIHGKSYQYMVYAFLYKNGYYNIVRGYGKRAGAGNNAVIRIYYLEQVTGDWSNLKMLSSEQQTHLRIFLEAAEKDVEILNLN
jgi:hypothetical protein